QDGRRPGRTGRAPGVLGAGRNAPRTRRGPVVADPGGALRAAARRGAGGPAGRPRRRGLRVRWGDGVAGRAGLAAAYPRVAVVPVAGEAAGALPDNPGTPA